MQYSFPSTPTALEIRLPQADAGHVVWVTRTVDVDTSKKLVVVVTVPTGGAGTVSVVVLVAVGPTPVPVVVKPGRVDTWVIVEVTVVLGMGG